MLSSPEGALDISDSWPTSRLPTPAQYAWWGGGGVISSYQVWDHISKHEEQVTVKCHVQTLISGQAALLIRSDKGQSG